MSTANKLIYLNETKTKLKNVINYSGANITNDTFRSYPEKLYDKFVDFVTNGTDSLYSSLPKVTGENTELTLNNTANGVLKLDFKGNTSQTTTTGINVLKYPYGNTTKTINGITFTDNGDGSITISGTATGNASFYLIATGSTIPDYLKTNITVRESGANGVIIQGSFDSSSGDFFANNTTINKDLSNVNTGYIRLYVQTGTSFSNPITILPYLVKGTYTSSTIPEFEKFSGGTSSPNSDYPQQIHVVTGDNDVKITGENLFDKKTMGTRIYRYIPSITTFSPAEDSYSIAIPCLPNKTYTISHSTENTTIFRYGYIKEAIIPATGNITLYAGVRGTTETTGTITTGDGATYLVFQGNADKMPYIIETFQVKLSSEEQTYRVSLGTIELCKIGDYQDYIYKENGNWYKYNAIGKVVLDGSETWNMSSYNVSLFYNMDLFNGKYLLQNAFSNYYKNIINTNINNNQTAYNILKNGEFSFRMGTKDRIYIKNTNFTDISNFKNWLSTHNTEVYYVLATPTYTLLDDTLQEQLDEIYYNAVSYEGQTNISQTNADLPFVIGASAIKNYESLEV